MNILLLFRINKLKEQCFIYNEKYNLAKKDANKVTQYEFFMQTSIENNDFRLNQEIIVKDSIGREIPIRDLFNNTEDYILVCRFSERYCTDCNSNAIAELRKLNDAVMTKNITLFCLYDTDKGLNLMKHSYGIKGMRVYNSPGFNIPAEKKSYPYYFVMDNTLRVFDVFFPDKYNPEITEKYFKLITEKYFNNATTTKQL